MVRLILIATGAATAIAFMVALHMGWTWPAVVLKPLPVLALAAALLPARTWPARLVVAGLVLSAAGDVLLELPWDLFVPGLVAFLLAHVAYAAGFVAGSRAWAPLRAIPFAAYGAAAFLVLRPGLGEMTLPVGIYVAVICVMMWRAAARPGHDPDRRVWLGVAGAAIFALSDTLIAVDRFMVPVPAADDLIMITYWAGQLGIGLSVRRSGRDPSRDVAADGTSPSGRC